MKNLFATVFLLSISLAAHCQVNFENISFQEALQKLKATGKIIFLQFESADCSQCNEVAHKAFENKKLSNLLEQVFICINITAGNSDRKKLTELYNLKSGFGSLFINADGTLIHIYPGSTTYVKTYEEHVDKVLTKASEGLRLSDMEKEYKSGNKRPGLMELLLQTRNTLNLETDILLYEYVSQLPADSLNSERTLTFIAQMAPVLESRASN